MKPPQSEPFDLDMDPKAVCTKCGIIGADVRPDWSPHTKSEWKRRE